ncbi:MAG: hypothetical protein QOH88_2183 [Verrucomicrobiota bacterium]|jgi:hypothetical protein
MISPDNPDEMFSEYGPKVLANGPLLRKFLLEHLPGITEQPDRMANLIGYNYGTGYKDLICTIMMSKKGVKLGFYKGGELRDPHHLLTGTGKVHKYVEIDSPEDINNPALEALLSEAIQARLKRASAS